MYAALWRVLPGPWWLRALVLLILLAVVLFALVTWVFPWIDAMLNPEPVTVDQTRGGQAA